MDVRKGTDLTTVEHVSCVRRTPRTPWAGKVQRGSSTPFPALRPEIEADLRGVAYLIDDTPGVVAEIAGNDCASCAPPQRHLRS